MSYVTAHQATLGVFLLAVNLTVGVPVGRLTARGDHWRRVSALSDEAGGGRDAGGGTVGYEVVATCKATCIQEMLNWPPSDKQCLDSDECVVCWQLCELLHKDDNKWRPTCKETDCSTGCTLACNFDFTKAKSGWSDSTWKFPPAPITTELGSNDLALSWPLPRRTHTPPTGSHGVVLPVFFVYTLLFRVESSPYWSKATSTVNLEADVTGDHASLPGLRFLLLASSTSGTACVAHPPYPGVAALFTQPAVTTSTARPRPPLPAQPVVPRWDPSLTDNSPRNQRKSNSEQDPSEGDQPGRLWGLSVFVETTHEGRLRAVVTWRHQLWHPLPLFYAVTWGRHSCNVNPAAPHCRLQDEEVTAEIVAKEPEEMKLVLSELTYNSQYRLDLSLSGAVPEQVYFYTPVCIQPSPGFTQCAEKVRSDPTPTHPTTTSTTDSTSTGTTTTTTTPTTITTTTTQALPADLQNVKPVNDVQEADSSFLGDQLQVILLNAAVTVITLVLAMVGWCLYRRFCRRPNPNRELLKAMQAYASLPMLNASVSQSGSLANLIQHHVNQQALLYSSLQSSSTGNAQSVLGSASMYHSVDNQLDNQIQQSGPTPQPPPLTTLPPLRNIPNNHMGVSYVRQAPPSAPRMGTRALHVTENPLYRFGEPVLPPIHSPENPILLAMAAAGDREAHNNSMESLNRVSASLGLPCVVHKAGSIADLVLHGWQQPDDTDGQC